MPDSDVDSVFLTVRSLARRASDACLPVFAAFTALRSRPIVVFWRRDLLRTVRRRAASSDGSFDNVAPAARSFTIRAFNFSFPALDPSRAWRSQKTSSDSDRARASASPSILTSLCSRRDSLDSFFAVSLMPSVLSFSRSRRSFSRTIPVSRRTTSLSSRRSSVRSDLMVSFCSGDRSSALRRRRLCAGRGPAAPSEAGAARAWRSRAFSLRSASTVSRVDAMPASETSVSRRATSACKEGTSLAARRASFVSSTASLSLPQQALNRDFHEPTSLREGHFRPAQLLRARFGRVRPRPFPLRAGVRLLIQRPPVARRMHGRGGRVAAADLDQRQVRAETFVENHHAIDDSAWQKMLPAPIVGPRFDAGSCARWRSVHGPSERLQEFLGRPFDAVMSMEIGGGNGVHPTMVAALTGYPVVDADGMGRAYPELQMTSFAVAGLSCIPFALSDIRENDVLITKAIDSRWVERMARRLTSEVGSTATICMAPRTGAEIRAHGILHTTTQAIGLGHAVLEARRQHLDPVAAIIFSGTWFETFHRQSHRRRPSCNGRLLKGPSTY